MKMDRNNIGRNKLLNQKILLIFTVLILSLAVITLVYASQFVIYSQSDFDAGYRLSDEIKPSYPKIGMGNQNILG